MTRTFIQRKNPRLATNYNFVRPISQRQRRESLDRKADAEDAEPP